MRHFRCTRFIYGVDEETRAKNFKRFAQRNSSFLGLLEMMRSGWRILGVSQIPFGAGQSDDQKVVYHVRTVPVVISIPEIPLNGEKLRFTSKYDCGIVEIGYEFVFQILKLESNFIYLLKSYLFYSNYYQKLNCRSRLTKNMLQKLFVNILYFDSSLYISIRSNYRFLVKFLSNENFISSSWHLNQISFEHLRQNSVIISLNC